MLNLLPPKQKKELRLRFLNKTIACFVIAIILIILSLILFLFLAQKFLKVSLEEKEIELSSWQSKSKIQELEKLEDQLQEVNRNVVFLNKKLEQRVEFYLILEKLAEYTPLEIRVDNLYINNSREVIISGYSPSRNNLLAFKENLEKSSVFTNLDFPLSNLAKTENIKFHFSFKADNL